MNEAVVRYPEEGFIIDRMWPDETDIFELKFEDSKDFGVEDEIDDDEIDFRQFDAGWGPERSEVTFELVKETIGDKVRNFCKNLLNQKFCKKRFI